MNKKYIPGVIVVEGSHDASKLSLLYDTAFVVTNGYEVPDKEVNFLKALKNDVQVIVLTDADEAGRKIREKVNAIRNNVINIEIEAPKSSKKKGVAECTLSSIQKELDKYVSEKKTETKYNLYKLGLVGQDNSKELREIISDKFNLGLTNKNNMVKRLNLLGITNKELTKEINNANSR